MSMVTIQEALERAKQCHRAGQLAEAEKIYRQILKAEPRQADAMHRLGLVAFQVGNKETALGMINHAIEVNPSASEYLSNRGMILASLGRWGEAWMIIAGRFSYMRIIRRCITTWAMRCRTMGRNEEALTSLRRALEIRPDYPEAHNNLGIVLQCMGKLDEAIAAFRKAVELRPDFAEGCKNLGGALASAGKWEEAIGVCKRATGLRCAIRRRISISVTRCTGRGNRRSRSRLTGRRWRWIRIRSRR